MKKNQINKMNKKKLQSGLIIVAIIFPLIFIGPSIFLMGNMNGETEIFEKKFKVFDFWFNHYVIGNLRTFYWIKKNFKCDI